MSELPECACGETVGGSFCLIPAFSEAVADGYCEECETRCCRKCFHACYTCGIEENVVLRGLCRRCDAKLARFLFFRCAEGHTFRFCGKCYEHNKEDSGEVQCFECMFDNYFDYRFETEDWSAGLFRCKPQ